MANGNDWDLDYGSPYQYKPSPQAAGEAPPLFASGPNPFAPKPEAPGIAQQAYHFLDYPADVRQRKTLREQAVGALGDVMNPPQAVYSALQLGPSGAQNLRDIGAPEWVAQPVGAFTDVMADPTLIGGLAARAATSPQMAGFVAGTGGAVPLSAEALKGVKDEATALAALRRTIPRLKMSTEPVSRGYSWTKEGTPTAREAQRVFQIRGPEPTEENLPYYVGAMQALQEGQASASRTGAREFGRMRNEPGQPAIASTLEKTISPARAARLSPEELARLTAAESLETTKSGQHEIEHAYHAAAAENPDIIPFLSPERQTIAQNWNSPDTFKKGISRVLSETMARGRDATIDVRNQLSATGRNITQSAMERARDIGRETFLSKPSPAYAQFFSLFDPKVGRMYQSGELANIYANSDSMSQFVDTVMGMGKK